MVNTYHPPLVTGSELCELCECTVVITIIIIVLRAIRAITFYMKFTAIICNSKQESIIDLLNVVEFDLMSNEIFIKIIERLKISK